MTKKKNRQAAAARAAAVRKAEQARERRRTAFVVGGILLALVLIAVVGVVLQSQRDTTGEESAAPAHTTSAYGVLVGDRDAETSIVVYEDFQCPICQQLETATAEALGDAIDDGSVNVEYRIVSFLDHASGNEYSSRAANASLVVLDQAGPEAFREFHDLLFANQPAEGTDGPGNDELIQRAVEAGAAEADVAEGIEDGEFDQWVVNATDAMSQEGVTGTPTVFVDGELVEWTSIPDLAALVEQAIG